MAKKRNKQPAQIQFPARGNFWTPNDEQAFHEAVVALHNKTHMPDGDPQGYRERTTQFNELYVLSEKQELQLADDFAFLFPAEESSKTITAAAIEEHNGGTTLVLRIASNEMPKQKAVDDFQKIIAVVQKYAMEGGERDAAREQLFETVLEARSRRILQRLRTPNGGLAGPSRSGPSLHDRLWVKMNLLKTCRSPAWSKARRTQFNQLCQGLELLLRVYKSVDLAGQRSNLKAALRNVVMKSYELSTRNGTKITLEKQLADFGFDFTHSGTKEVLQVDKIGRYYACCRDILHIVRRHRKLFQDISLKLCHAVSAKQPPGAAMKCHVHGEMKLAMHYERHPHYPHPRAMGSSKSMCFLCGLFIETHGRYWVSHCHKRLYPMWTIPDTNWMNKEQTDRFQLIVGIMTQELVRLRNRAVGGAAREPPESRCPSFFSYTPSLASAALSAVTIRTVAAPARSLTPTQATYYGNGETISQSKEALGSIVEDVATLQLPDVGPECQSPSPPPMPPEYRPDIATIHLSGEAQASVAEVLAKQQPPALYTKKVHPSPQDALPTPPASPVIVPRPPPPRSPSLRLLPFRRSLPTPHSAAPSHLAVLPTSIPLTHIFSFHSPDIEITAAGTLFIFEFACVTSGTLTLEWHDMADSRDPFSPDVAAGLHGSLETRPRHLIDLTTLGDEAVCMKGDREPKACKFIMRVNAETAMKIEIVWDEVRN